MNIGPGVLIYLCGDDKTQIPLNGSFRDECLNVNWFLSLPDLIEKIEHGKFGHNNFRPHSSLEDLTPEEVYEECINKH